MNSHIGISKFCCSSAAAFGEKSSWKMALKISKVCFHVFLVISMYFNAFQAFVTCSQAFLLVRGGLWREILVKNDIVNFENAFSSCFAHFQAFWFVRGGLRREILVKNGILKFESAFVVKITYFNSKMTKIDNFFE